MINTFEEEKDPDYNDFHENQSVDRSKLKEQDTKLRTVSKITNILKEQFDKEIEVKSYEVSVIDQRIRQSKAMLDRLRAYIVASYYGSGEKLVPMAKSINIKKQKVADKALEINNDGIVMGVSETLPHQISTGKVETVIKKEKDITELAIESDLTVNRFYSTKKVIVGNVSKYLVVDNHKEKDKATHKWMVYVRGPTHEPDISSYVKSVWFFLHPSYIPNDIVQVHKPPFQLTRRGWGEFPIRIQLHFHDGDNKRFDIIHNLKLDKTYTGLQTLGAETIVQLELRRHTKDWPSNSQSLPNSQRVLNEEPSSGSCSDNIKDTHATTCKVLESVQSNDLEDELNTEREKENYINTPSLEKKDLFLKLQELNNPMSAVSSCVASAAVSRCSSPVNLSVTQLANIITDDETNLILHELVRDSPLIDLHADMRLTPFTCSSLELYKQWSFSKRRASEWQRAVFLKRLFVEYIDSDEKLLVVPTTKQIMIWCRRNGYSPYERNLAVVNVSDNILFCTLCGISIDIKQENLSHSWCPNCVIKESTKVSDSSISSFTPVLKQLQENEEALISLNKLQSLDQYNSLDDSPINITDYDACDQIQERTTNKITLSSTDELDWIYNSVNQIGIHMPNVTISEMRAPILQSMLLKCLKCFASELLHKSNCEAIDESKSTLQPALLTFKHVDTTIKKNPKLDFLSDAFMGTCNIKAQSKNT